MRRSMATVLAELDYRESAWAEHEAIAEEASESVPNGTVVRQWKCGYRMGSRLLRPAAVVVSSGPAVPATPSESAAAPSGAQP